jgi:hypothetical protein
VYTEYRKAVTILESVGGLFRFKEDPDGVVYKIKSVEPVERFRNYQSELSLEALTMDLIKEKDGI